MRFIRALAILSPHLALPSFAAAAATAAPLGAAEHAPLSDELILQRQHPLSNVPEVWARVRLSVLNLVDRISDIRLQLKSLDVSDQGPAKDSVLRFNVRRPEEAEALLQIADSWLLDVWNVNRHHVDIRLSESDAQKLRQALPRSLRNSYEVLIEQDDLDHLTTAHRSRPSPSQKFSLSLDGTGRDVFFEDYRPLSVISPWFLLLESLFPTHVRQTVVGQTFEGRNITALRVGMHPANDRTSQEPRKTIIVSAGNHAREWISTAVVNYIAHHFITLYGRSSRITRLIEDFDWIFIPTTNPDGYLQTWEHDRLWRKTMQTTSVPWCKGMDLDRSYDVMWDRYTGSPSPCSGNYAGEHPFEAVEAQTFAEWVRNEIEGGTQFVGFLDLHSYSQQILYPYAFSCHDDPPTLEDLEEMSEGLAKVMRRYGTFYDVLPACKSDTASLTSLWPDHSPQGGSPLDWFYREIGVRHSYQIKLPDTGSYGFLLPREYIVPTGEETLSAVLYFGTVLQDGPPGTTNQRSNITEASD